MSTHSHPDSYKAYAFLEKGGPLVPITFEWKDPQPGEIVVKVLACGHQTVPAVRYPIVPGHEIVGDVAAVPATETKWTVGQRVGSGWHGGHCHSCASCVRGDYIVCEKEDINGILRHGGYAEYVTLRTEAVAAVPDGMDPAEAAPLFCAGVTTFNSLRNMSCKPPAYVAIQGIGGLGHLGIQFSKAMGFRTVALSTSAAKEELARSLGADIYLDGSKVNHTEALRQLGGASVVMCTAPNTQIIREMIHALAPRGELLVLALTDNANVDLGEMIIKGLSVRGWPSGSATDSGDCLEFAKANNVRVMVERFPLDKANEAFDHRGSARFRAVLIP
ncbi:GroES-like protein [Wolfiporia cocos MD-104 SS10]|uniref:GroES-like protein n=1 Tax=Wolfiporia cocos (strain MD-104) TaxID=742152 RepID=A0A2H3J9Y0_WOLCO|nr:GroES-like protein [Wolfiporia cocos MD-104 SS10]